MDIILFSTADWDNPFWTNKQHMAKVFEKNGHRVIYIDSLGLRRPTLSNKDLKRVLKRLKSILKPYSHVSTGIWRITPFIIPFHNSKLISKFNNWLLVSTIKVLAFFLGFSKPMIWTYSPITDQVVDMFDSEKIVYHCVDDMTAFPGVDSVSVSQRELALIKKSDAVFTTSSALFDRISQVHTNTHYHNNVCDNLHFSMATEMKFDPPPELTSISGPKIIFIGAISDYKIDFGLIKSIASENKKWHWLLIGEVGEGQPKTTIDELVGMENIHFLGAKEYTDLPKYLQYADVAVIPAKLNRYTESMFPMKFFEYLSAGKQVVTTDLVSLKEYNSLYFNSRTEDEFSRNLELVLEKSVCRDKNTILEFCQKQTWQNRYDEMMRILIRK